MNLGVYGLGIASPAGIGKATVIERLKNNTAPVPTLRSAEDATLGLFLPALPVPALSGGRRMSPWLRMALSAGQEAVSDCSAEQRNALNIVSATGFGSLKHTADFLTNLIRNQESEPQPANFIFSVHNAAATQTAIALGSKGANYTLSSVDTGLEQALVLADKLSGLSLVLAADEYQPLANESQHKARYWKAVPVDPSSSACPGEGAAAVLVGPAQPGQITIRSIRAGFLPRKAPDVELEQAEINCLLAEAGVTWRDLDAVITNASQVPAWDRGLDAVWSHWPVTTEIPRRSYKPWTGEFPSASGCGLAITILAMQMGGWPDVHECKMKTVLFYNRSRFGFRSMVVLQR